MHTGDVFCLHGDGNTMSSGIHNHITGYHNRRSIRLRDHDYSQPGYYFITVCIEQPKKRLFGNVIDGRMLLNDAGKCTERCWRDIPAHFPQVKLDEFVVMPNHVHGIIVIRDSAENHMVTGTNIVAAGETDTHPTVVHTRNVEYHRVNGAGV